MIKMARKTDRAGHLMDILDQLQNLSIEELKLVSDFVYIDIENFRDEKRGYN